MYALLTRSQDLILSRENLNFKNIGLQFKGYWFAKNVPYEHWVWEDGKLVYKIINKKKFTFFCIKMGILPEIRKKNPLLFVKNDCSR